MKVRLATENDLSALMALVKRVLPPMLAAGNPQWDENYPNESVFREDIELGQLWLAEVDREIAGVTAITSAPEPEYAQAGLDIGEPVIVVHRLAVDPAFRGAGIAAALMQKAEEVAIQNGIDALRVDTGIRNEATQRLFPKLGYRLAGEISLKVKPGQRFLCYEKRLSS
jgi:GNAT superfamily N-acetyltransferase